MGTGYKIPMLKKKESPTRSILREASKPIKEETKKPINILISHENRIDYHTQKAHNLAKILRETSEFNPIIDTDYFKQKEKVSPTEINRREKIMVKISDVIVRLVSPSSKTGESRHEGPVREVRKAIYSNKPVIEIFYQGAKDSPNRPPQEKNYKYRIPIYLKRGESLQKAIRRGWNEYLNVKKTET